MKLSEFKNHLAKKTVPFSIILPTGENVPEHFHITEMGTIHKRFTDCGNTFREEDYFTFQLWYSVDLDHRLTPEKVLKIISGIEKKETIGDYEIQVEYQEENTIGKFGLDFNGKNFVLTSTKTTCLAQDNCGIPQKVKKNLSELASCGSGASNCC